MKYFTIGMLCILSAWNISAQKTAGAPVLPAQIDYQHADKAILDTIFHNFFNLNPTLYTAPVGGYMNGTNGYGDVEKGQETKFTETYYLTGVIYWFALKVKNTGGDTSSIIFKLYKKDAAQMVNGVNRLVPGTLLASQTVELNNINAGTTFASGLNLFSLPQPIVNFSNYVSTFSMEMMHPKDTIALYGSEDSLVDITDLSWEKWNGKWNTIKNAWVLDIDFAIFPVRDLTGASIEEQQKADVQLFPNPATDYIYVALSSDAYDSYVVMNATGQPVKTGNITSSQFQIDLQDYASGYYVIGVYNETSRKAEFYRFIKN